MCKKNLNLIEYNRREKLKEKIKKAYKRCCISIHKQVTKSQSYMIFR